MVSRDLQNGKDAASMICAQFGKDAQLEVLQCDFRELRCVTESSPMEHLEFVMSTHHEPVYSVQWWPGALRRKHDEKSLPLWRVTLLPLQECNQAGGRVL